MITKKLKFLGRCNPVKSMNGHGQHYMTYHLYSVCPTLVAGHGGGCANLQPFVVVKHEKNFYK